MEIKTEIKPDIRYVYDIKSVIYDKKWLESASNFEIYYMYRKVKEQNKLRYDITIIPANMLGKEFVKTKGHKHKGKYQELYQVLEGSAIYLAQKMKADKIVDIYAVKVKKNEFVIIPCDYEHITINPSKKELKMANWISKKCENNYKTIEEKHGAGYFYTKQGWIKNKNYKNTPKLRFEKSLKQAPQNLEFLK
ncbi:MAG: glucose-6-phosphate isomerase family protein [Patescibacteria group bacterium]|nr:glucose-6-phosphate isomerase family protein [Patescibacteria group bacterium]